MLSRQHSKFLVDLKPNALVQITLNTYLCHTDHTALIQYWLDGATMSLVVFFYAHLTER